MQLLITCASPAVLIPSSPTLPQQVRCVTFDDWKRVLTRVFQHSPAELSVSICSGMGGGMGGGMGNTPQEQYEKTTHNKHDHDESESHEQRSVR
jgi:hypothetical protein